jgi:uncharacterized protein (TIGR02996 family)
MPTPNETKQAFLDAIRVEPNNDMHRRALADWLEEHGGPVDVARAEFIQIQIRLEGMSYRNKDFRALKDREKELLAAHRTEWATQDLQLLPEEQRQGLHPDWLTFSRGMADVLTLSHEERQALAALHRDITEDPQAATDQIIRRIANHFPPLNDEPGHLPSKDSMLADRLALRTLLAARAPACKMVQYNTNNMGANVFHILFGFSPPADAEMSSWARQLRQKMLVDVMEEADPKVWRDAGQAQNSSGNTPALSINCDGGALSLVRLLGHYGVTLNARRELHQGVMSTATLLDRVRVNPEHLAKDEKQELIEVLREFGAKTDEELDRTQRKRTR